MYTIYKKYNNLFMKFAKTKGMLDIYLQREQLLSNYSVLLCSSVPGVFNCDWMRRVESVAFVVHPQTVAARVGGDTER